jgi:hypothetical protein
VTQVRFWSDDGQTAPYCLHQAAKKLKIVTGDGVPPKIEALETVTSFFARSSLPEILEKWFVTNPSLTAPLQAIDLSSFSWRENGWLRAELISIYKSS